MKKTLLRLLLGTATIGLSYAAQAQTGSVGIGTTAPDASAVLDLTSTTKGLLAPRMTATERTAIASPAAGLLVYQTDGVQPGFWYHTGAAWTYLSPSASGDNLGNHIATQNLNLGTNLLTGGGTQGLSISSSGGVGIGGIAPTNWLDVQGESRSGAHATGRPLYITGGFDEAGNGVEFRHSNGTQGIGFGFNSIYAAGSNANQHLNLMPKGSGNVGIGTTSPAAKLDVPTGSVRLPGGGGSDTWFNFPGNGQNYLRGTTILADIGGSVGIGTGSPAASALVEMASTTKGVLLPRLTLGQRDAIASPATGLTLYNSSTGRLNTWNGVSWTEALLTTEDGAVSALFGPTGAVQTFTVPTGVTSLQVDMQGGNGTGASIRGSAGGVGGRVQATLTVTPGQVLSIYVASGTWNGGGAGDTGGGAGGGASDIRVGGTALSNRVLVAGGGGGGGGENTIYERTTPGGCGGGLTACDGQPGNASFATGGSGASQAGPGGGPNSAQNGSLGQGGSGVAISPYVYQPGGGGGGYYGGGGGSRTGSGGGGSSYSNPALTSNVVYGTGSATAFVRLSYTRIPAPVLSLSNATVSQAAGSVIFSDGSKLAGNAGQLYWDNTGTRLGIGTGSPQAKLHVAGNARVDGLAGSGTRMVTTDNNGQLVAQPFPADNDNQQLSIAGSTLSLTNGGSITLPAGADNLGNHTATQTLTLNDNLLRLRGGTDNLHVLQYYSAPDGPALVGYNGGLLGYNKGDGNGIITALRWANNGYVGLGDGVSSTPLNRLDIRIDTRTGNHATDRALYVTGPFEEAANGVEFRHTNGTSGVGIGFNSLYAAGTNTNQPLNLMPKGTGGVGIGTTMPGALLDVNGVAIVRGSVNFGTSTRQMINLFNGDYGIGVQGGTQYFRTGEAFAWYTSGTHNDNQFNSGGGTTQMVLKGGQLGIGTSSPIAALDVPTGTVHLPGDSWIRYFGDNKNYLRGTTVLADNGGYVGIGTANPAFPLDVQSSVTPGNYSYAFYAYSGGPYTGSTGSSTGAVSIRATARIIAPEFNATSDRRLKNVIGLSNSAADLALLTKLRITDYTMRDRATYGQRQFKKVIAQEVEEVFPQAVQQHTGFLPDVYAQATQAALLPGDSLLQVTLPKALAAKAGQRMKLIGEKSEVTATVARTVSGNALVLRGAKELAGQKVFVFGLEHADVRTVDYEALAMLNVSATQELARQLAELQKQNAALRQQAQEQTTRLDQQQAALHTLQAQATQTTDLNQRLQALENMLGTNASVK